MCVKSVVSLSFYRLSFALLCPVTFFISGVDPPKPLPLHIIARQVLKDTPRVTRFPIDWA